MSPLGHGDLLEEFTSGVPLRYQSVLCRNQADASLREA